MNGLRYFSIGNEQFLQIFNVFRRSPYTDTSFLSHVNELQRYIYNKK